MVETDARVNRQIVLKQRPIGLVSDECFNLVETPLPRADQLADGEALVRNIYLSVDPTQRGWMSRDTYMPAIQAGEVIRSGSAGQVVASRNARLPVGTLVSGLTGWSEYAVVGGNASPVPAGIDLRASMSVLGATGLTAYFGMLDIGRPRPGETVLVSGAAGATGSVAGQIARIQGARVVGLAGTAEKCAWLIDELGFAEAINYRSGDVPARLREACPNGIDVYFDNVGGSLLELVLERIRMKARIVLCGAISQYSDEEPSPGPRNLMQLVIQRSRMEGFLVFDYLERYPEAAAQLSHWVRAGDLHYRVEVMEGLEAAPRALQALFTGGNTGKLLVQLVPEP
jgi:NADPH-dependent curcumin reductase CurA